MRHKSGRYYARIFAKGKETWKSLKTDLLEVAKAKLRKEVGDIEKVTKASAALDRGRMTVGQCEIRFRERLEKGFGLAGRGGQIRRITPGAILYRQKTLVALFKSWPGLRELDVRSVSEGDVEEWAERFSASYSATVYNNTLDTMRALFRIAIDAGARHGNPAEKAGRVSVKTKPLELPGREQFLAFVESIREGGGRFSRHCADFVQFLAFTGARKDEAANVIWSDVDFTGGRILLRVTKGGVQRFVPMIAEARELLTRLRAERADESPSDPVLLVNEAQKSMDKAAAKIGFARITHHDLRHLFATTCIESEIDIPTVSRWLGHKDGGALAMKTYGHLRDEHSMQAAKRVSFAAPAAAQSSHRDQSSRK